MFIQTRIKLEYTLPSVMNEIFNLLVVFILVALCGEMFHSFFCCGTTKSKFFWYITVVRCVYRFEVYYNFFNLIKNELNWKFEYYFVITSSLKPLGVFSLKPKPCLPETYTSQ